MKILLTGGTGFIGSYVLRSLLADGCRVTTLVRDPSRLRVTRCEHLTVVQGNITDAAAVHASMRGCNTVIHLAALVGRAGKCDRDFAAANVEGTRLLLQAAEGCRAEKFVFASSFAAHSVCPHDVVTEECFQTPSSYFSEYAATKAAAEEMVTCARIPYVIVYPTRVFGVGPLTDANGATKALSLYLHNRLPFLIAGGEQYASWAFVNDVAGGIITAATDGAACGRYILGGENRTLAEAYRMADEITKRKHLRIVVDMKSALMLASAAELHATLFRRKPFITREWLRYIMESQKVSSSKAIAGLNYRITPFRTALEETVRWLATL